MASNNAINNEIVDNNFDVLGTGNITIGNATPANPARLSIEESVAGSTGFSVQNTLVNANASAKGQFIVEVGAGDPHCNYVVNGGPNWSIGLDNSDTDAFKITTGATPSAGTTVLGVTTGLAMTMPSTSVTMNGGQLNFGTGVADDAINIGTGANAGRTVTIGNTTGTTAVNMNIGTGDFTITSATGTLISQLDTGEMTKPLQPAFLAYLLSADLNVTGAGTNYTIGTNVAFSEIFDIGSNFNTNGTFTAPVTGKYQFNTCVRMTDITAAMTRSNFNILASNNRVLAEDDPADAINASGFYSEKLSALIDMDAGDTCVVRITIFNGAGDTADISGGAGGTVSFSGYLVS